MWGKLNFSRVSVGALLVILSISFLGRNLQAEPAGEDPFAPENPVIGAIPIRALNPHLGKPLDTDKRRTMRVLTPEEAANYGAEPGETVVANFLHGGKFFVARIPESAVQEVVLQKIKFDKKLPAHYQVRFVLHEDKPVTLVSQDGKSQPNPTTIPDMVFSAEPAPREGTQVNPYTGLLPWPNYMQTFLLQSGQQNFNQYVGVWKHKVGQELVDFPDQVTRDAFLTNLVNGSTEKGYGSPYHSICNNCTTASFSFLNQMLPKVKGMLLKPTIFVPYLSEKYPSYSGLVDGSIQLPTINDEKDKRYRDKGESIQKTLGRYRAGESVVDKGNESCPYGQL